MQIQNPSLNVPEQAVKKQKKEIDILYIFKIHISYTISSLKRFKLIGWPKSTPLNKRLFGVGVLSGTMNLFIRKVLIERAEAMASF